MNRQESEIFGLHAVAIDVAVEFLAEASKRSTKEDWLAVVMATTQSRCRDMSQDEITAILNRMIGALGIQVIEPEDPIRFEADEPSRFPFVNEDDPNSPGPGDQL